MLSSSIKINAYLKSIADGKPSYESCPQEIFLHIFQEAEQTYARYSTYITEMLEWLNSGCTEHPELQQELQRQKHCYDKDRQHLVSFCHRIWYSRCSTDLKLFLGSVMLLFLNNPTSIQFHHFSTAETPITLLMLLENPTTLSDSHRHESCETLRLRQQVLYDDYHAVKTYFARVKALSNN